MPKFSSPFMVLILLLSPALAGGTDRSSVLAPPAVHGGAPVRDLQLAADAQGHLVLAAITDNGSARTGRGTFTARTVRAWRWADGRWTPLGGVLNYDQPRPAARLNLALDAAGTPVLTWNENYGDNDVVVFRAWQNGTWTNWPARYLGISSPQAAKTRAVAAWQGEPILIWGENVRQGVGTLLTVRRWRDKEWLRSAPLNEAARFGRQPALVLNRQGNATAAWLEGDVYTSQVIVKRQSGDRWIPMGRPLSRHGPTYVTSPQLALDPQGRPVVAWLEDAGGRDTLFTSRWTGERWEALGGSVSTGFASAPSFTLTRDGQPVVAWVKERGSLGQIQLARWTGRAWQQFGTVNRDAARDARSPSVAVEAAGTVVLAWREDAGGVYRLQVRRFRL